MLEGMAVALLSGGVGAAIAQPGPVVQVRTHAEPVVLVVSWMPRPPTVSAGTAHLVEHLSYAAAPGWSPGAWDQALEQMGGWSEGWTTPAGVGGGANGACPWLAARTAFATTPTGRPRGPGAHTTRRHAR